MGWARGSVLPSIHPSMPKKVRWFHECGNRSRRLVRIVQCNTLLSGDSPVSANMKALRAADAASDKRESELRKGESDENDNQTQASHSSIAVDPLRRPRSNFPRRMCRGTVCDGV